MSKAASIYNKRKQGVSDRSWFARAKRRELVLIAGSCGRRGMPLPDSEIAHLVTRGVRIPRSMRPV